MDKEKADILMDEFGCEYWESVGNKVTIRFVTSFNTKIEDVNELIDFVKNIK